MMPAFRAYATSEELEEKKKEKKAKKDKKSKKMNKEAGLFADVETFE